MPPMGPERELCLEYVENMLRNLREIKQGELCLECVQENLEIDLLD